MVKLLLFISCFVLSVSCGLKYEPGKTIEQFSKERKTAVERFVQFNYADSNVTYNSLLFGETVVERPPVYRTLDSLYEIKYKLERSNQYDSELEEKIGIQKQILNRDSSQITYVEDHIFAINNENKSEISFAKFRVDKTLNTSIIDIYDQVVIPANLLPFYITYLKEESITYAGYAANLQERRFFNYFKEKEATLSGEERNQFLEHTLKIMVLARQKRTIAAEKLIETLVGKELQSSIDELDFESIEGLYEEDVLTHYLAKVKKKDTTYLVLFDSYYQFISNDQI